jgi:proline iminopeptidase
MRYLLLVGTILFSLNCVAQNEKQIRSFIPQYQTFGKGYPILIINGGPGMNSNGFVDIAKKIAALGYQTIIFDQRGTGKSKLEQINSETISMNLMVEDLENLRTELHIEKWIVFGHSFGGLLSCAYYSKYPDKVQKLIFSSSGGVNLNFINYVNNRIQSNLTEKERDSLKFYQNKISQGDTTINTLKKRAFFLSNAYVFDKNFAYLIAERLMEVNFSINQLVFQDLMKSKFDYTHKFVEKDIPVLILQGKNDIISLETAQEIKNSFGNANVILLENCAHYGWLDNPKHYFEAIEKFLKK